MHDPFQTYPHYGFQYPSPQNSYVSPQQLQQASLLALQNPLLAAAMLSNSLAAAGLHSPVPSPYGAPQFGLQSQMGSPYGQNGAPQFGLQSQMGSPYGQNGVPQFGLQSQMGSPFGQIGFPLAPQSWIGQGGFGPIHPLQSQLIPRPFQAQGLSPWGY